MKIVAKIFQILLIALLAFTVFTQGMTIYSIAVHNHNVAQILPERVYALRALIATNVVMFGGVTVYYLYKKRPAVGILLSTAAAVAFIVIAFDLKRVFPSSILAYGAVGVDTLKMLWRHMSPALLPVFMLGAWLFGRQAEDRQASKKAIKQIMEGIEKTPECASSDPLAPPLAAKRRQEGIVVKGDK